MDNIVLYSTTKKGSFDCLQVDILSDSQFLILATVKNNSDVDLSSWNLWIRLKAVDDERGRTYMKLLLKSH